MLLFLLIIVLLALFAAYIGPALAGASNILIIKAPDFIDMLALPVEQLSGRYSSTYAASSRPNSWKLDVSYIIDNNFIMVFSSQ